MEQIERKLHRHAIHILDRIMTDVAELNYIVGLDDAGEKVRGMSDLADTIGRVFKTYTFDITKLREAYHA